MRFAEFIIASALIEVTPGPNMSYLATLAMTRGLRPALGAVLGTALGLATIGILTAFGLDAFLDRYPLVDVAFRWGGVLFMLWLALEGWRKAGMAATDHQPSRLGSFGRGLVTNLLNLKSVVFYVAVVPDFIDLKAGNIRFQNLVLVAVYVAIATIVHLGIILAASRAQRLMMDVGRKKIVGRVMAILLIGIAGWLGVEALS